MNSFVKSILCFLKLTTDIACFNNDKSQICLNSNQRCEVNVDLNSTETPGFIHRYEGTEALFTCYDILLLLRHEWLQTYVDGTIIGDVLKQNPPVTEFVINVEKFDNGSKICCNVFTKIIDKGVPKCTRIVVPNDILKKSEEPSVQRYNENTTVLFDCLEYEHLTKNITIGIINTSNKIKSFKTWRTNTAFAKADNGSMLCCVYFEVKGKETKTITRFVSKKTLLVYDESFPDSTMAANSVNAANQTIIIIIPTVLIIMVLLLILIVYKKRCRKISDSEDTHELETKSSTRVLYADLDILRQEGNNYHLPDSQEESPYAQIIGEMRPECKK